MILYLVHCTLYDCLIRCMIAKLALRLIPPHEITRTIS